jgi:ABC-type transport system substrate-binding protein
LALKLSDLDPSVARYYTYDPTQAKKLIDEAGATNFNFKFDYTINFAPKGPSYKTAAEMVNNMLNAVGVKTSLVPIDYLKDFIGAGKGSRYGNYPKDTLLFSGVAVFSDVDEVVYQYFDSHSTISEMQVKDPTIDSMLDKARTIVSEHERRPAYLNIEKYIASKLYAVAGLPQGYTYTEVVGWHCKARLRGLGREAALAGLATPARGFSRRGEGGANPMDNPG